VVHASETEKGVGAGQGASPFVRSQKGREGPSMALGGKNVEEREYLSPEEENGNKRGGSRVKRKKRRRDKGDAAKKKRETGQGGERERDVSDLMGIK
jgi:hypothetical protein